MTREHVKQLLPVLTAFAEGKTIEFKKRGEWEAIEDPCFTSGSDYYRIKPEPKLRPWKPTEIPMGGILRIKGASAHHLIVYFDTECGQIGAGRAFQAGIQFAFDECEWSSDNGKTWQPCGGEEAS